MTVPTPHEILAALDPEQRAVAQSSSGPMVVLAGAGTGKTRAITHRMAYAVSTGVHQPQRVLALTFTARAAGEMRTRLRGLGVTGVQARTFHAAALRQLHYFWPQAVGGPAPEVMPHKAGALAEALGRLRLDVDRTALRDLASEVEWAKVALVAPEGYAAAARAARRDPPAGLDHTAMARVMSTYEEVKAERGVMDFEDVLLVLLGILRERDDIARTIRGQYRHFVVDEFQDVSPLQHALLLEWLGERTDLCVVGDPAQTIYSFAGASADFLTGFTSRYPGAAVVHLVRNYRSTPQVVNLANALLTGPGGTRRSGSVELVSQRPAGTALTCTAHEDDQAEARAVAAAVRAGLDGGGSASSIAVLFRTNGQSEALEAALAEQDIPYLVRGGERFFQRREVREAIVLLRGAARSDDGSVPLPELVRDVIIGAGWSHRPPHHGGAAREVGVVDRSGRPRRRPVRCPRSHGSPTWCANSTSGQPASTRPLSRASPWLRCTLPRAWVGDRPPGRLLRRTVADLDGGDPRGHRGGAPAALCRGDPGSHRVGPHLGAVTLGRWPWHSPTLPLPRARRSSPRGAAVGAAKANRSRRAGAGSPAPGAGRRPTCRSCGADLATGAERTVGRCATCPPTHDQALFERLREWRSSTAKEASVPAYVVFTDATLTAIAEQQPTTHGELAAIRGVGARKLELYADEVLTLLHVDEDQSSTSDD